MRYVSTRGAAPVLGFRDVLLAGLARDGGLYVPESWPKVGHGTADAPYSRRAAEIIAAFVGDEIPFDVLLRLCDEAYATFRDPAVAPLRDLGDGHHLLELFHGPTLAFKDVALQLVGRLFDHVLAERSQTATIIGATSGDTGSAAIDGVRGCANVSIIILYPEGRVSEVQRRQMTTVDAANVHAVAVQGTFDDCQDLVKAMFNDADFRDRHRLAAVNSINWARVLAQVVYYFTAIEQLDRGTTSFSVPTGNFGNVLSGWIARRIGADVGHLIVGSNANDILTRFFETQSMQSREVVATLSPSMDIQVSSNFERLLFEMSGRDGTATARQLADFRRTGRLDVDAESYGRWIRPVFRGHRCSDDDTLATIRRIWESHGLLVDPHTAVGIAAAEACRDDDGQVVTLATAHPAKFPDAVFRATGQRPELPEHLADLHARTERTMSVPNDLDAVRRVVAERAHPA
ncbi:MAG: threonine synthase [Ilumatobacteraceae bacterium]